MGKTIGIIGNGKITSILRKLPDVVYIYDNDVTKTECTLNEVCSSDIIIFAVPLKNLDTTLEEYQGIISPEKILVNICSVQEMTSITFKQFFPVNKIWNIHPIFGRISFNKKAVNEHKIFIDSETSEEDIDEIKSIINDDFEYIIASVSEHDDKIGKSLIFCHLIPNIFYDFEEIKESGLYTNNFLKLLDIREGIENNEEFIKVIIDNLSARKKSLIYNKIKKSVDNIFYN